MTEPYTYAETTSAITITIVFIVTIVAARRDIDFSGGDA